MNRTKCYKPPKGGNSWFKRKHDALEDEVSFIVSKVKQIKKLQIILLESHFKNTLGMF